MPKLDLESIPQRNATGYPAAFANVVQGRWYRRLSVAAGLEDFGVSHVVLKPGAWSAQRHWHEIEDEFLVMVSGTATLVDDHGETPLAAGDCVAFPKNDGNGHCVINNSALDCTFVVVGQNKNGVCHYPDIDLHLPDGNTFTRKDGRRY
ncbi:MAG: cupin domain-containing protein [Gammaproteobacteria bacterium]|nr:cupin domain-containing protein [Gammaproteobacteria bacterium]MDH5304974.1 cupin domain-containing protein [Gammaproteobacteria bacterium]MDH5322000.1 cupin domain-containing protein [Gammaproteobacteria bacterium]